MEEEKRNARIILLAALEVNDSGDQVTAVPEWRPQLTG